MQLETSFRKQKLSHLEITAAAEHMHGKRLAQVFRQYSQELITAEPRERQVVSYFASSSNSEFNKYI